jgi:hypothetical protein
MRKLVALTLFVFLIGACAGLHAEQTTPRLIQMQDTARSTVLEVDQMVTKRVISSQEAEPVIAALRAVSVGIPAVFDALESYRKMRSLNTKTVAEEAIKSMTSALINSVVDIPDLTTRKAVWSRVQPVIDILSTVGLGAL